MILNIVRDAACLLSDGNKVPCHMHIAALANILEVLLRLALTWPGGFFSKDENLNISPSLLFGKLYSISVTEPNERLQGHGPWQLDSCTIGCFWSI